MNSTDSFHPPLSSGKAGWAEGDITPPFEIPLGGRGAVIHPADHLLTPLLAQVIALEDGRGERLLLVSLDLIGISSGLSETLQLRLAATAAILPERVILNCSHTHSGPMTHFDEFGSLLSKPQVLVDYENRLADQVACIAREALDRLEPATVAIRVGTSDIGLNRRLRNTDGTIVMGPNPNGPYNRELFLIEITQQQSGRRCLAYSHGCHPVFEVGWARTAISADFPGWTRTALREQGDLHAQFFQACCGNIRPRSLANFEARTFRQPCAGDAEETGRQLARDIGQTLREPARHLRLELKSVKGWFLAPKTHHATLDLKVEQQRGGAYKNAASYWQQQGWAGRPFAPVVPWPVGLFALAPDCHVAWFGGEPFAEWQAFLRRVLDDEQLIVWGYTEESASYLPTDEALSEGGYETVTELFRKYSPEPLAPGLGKAAATAFQRLKIRLATE